MSGGFDNEHMPHDPRLPPAPKPPPPPPLPPPPDGAPAPLPMDPPFGYQQFEHAESAPFERLAPPVRLLTPALAKHTENHKLLLAWGDARAIANHADMPHRSAVFALLASH